MQSKSHSIVCLFTPQYQSLLKNYCTDYFGNVYDPDLIYVRLVRLL